MHSAKTDLITAFKSYHLDSLHKMHLFLNQAYYRLMHNKNSTSPLNTYLEQKFKLAEDAWIDYEKNQCSNKNPCLVKINNSSVLQLAAKKHPVFKHKLFNYLSYDAELSELKKFVLGEAIINLEFNAAGRKKSQRFERLLCTLEWGYEREKTLRNLPWEGLANINLFSHFALHPYNKIKYFGLLVATEMLTTQYYRKLIKGICRLNLTPKNDQAFLKHETLDLEYAAGWLNKVVLPELAVKPYKTRDFWLGFYLRLDSAQRYYDSLLV